MQSLSYLPVAVVRNGVGLKVGTIQKLYIIDAYALHRFF